MARRSLILLVGTLLALAGCGGGGVDLTIKGDSGPSTVPGGADPAAVKVIDAWVDTLRKGDVEGAASYFAIPSVIQNGGPPVHIRSPQDAVLFNESLPCGAKLIRAVGAGRVTTATFRLTERPGLGSCGPGSGTTARTAFVIHDGKIVQWRRVGAAGGGGGSGQPV